MSTEKDLESSLLHIAIRLVFAEGEIGGTPCMGSHILVHGATTKFCDKPFIFKSEIEKEGLPRDSTPDLGAGGPGLNPGAQTNNFHDKSSSREKSSPDALRRSA